VLAASHAPRFPAGAPLVKRCTRALGARRAIGDNGPVRPAPRSRLQRIADVAVPVVVALFLASLVEDQARDQPGVIVALGILAALLQGAALWWRRTHPVAVMAIALAGGLVIHLVAPDGLFPYAGLIAIGSLAARRPLHVSLPALVLLLGLTALNYVVHPAEDVSFALAVVVVAWSLGEVMRNRMRAVAEAAQRAVADEQARIARELHDVIAHSVSVIVVQAAAADDVFDERPDQARAALRSIESAGRDALAELRRLLAPVRPATQDSGDPPQPQPGLAALDELIAPLRAAGLEVAVRREGSPGERPLPAGVDLSAYRIVQEALTNTLRHAGARHAEVTLRSRAGMLELDVRDDGRAGSADGAGTADGGGRGIAGMRERAAMLGGTLEAGPLPEGGFHVHARLPLEAAR
jgi:signal transduction histidine kinase